MKFSICIPNYNYARFLGRTLQSVLDQTYGDFEIIVSDNASTDDSLRVVDSFADPRVRRRVNRTNVGFAGNLDRAAGEARGDVIILLSSDDVMLPDALATYAALYRALGNDAERTIVTSSCEQIDADDRTTAILDLPRNDVWRAGDVAAEFESIASAPVLLVASAELLARSLRTMQNPYFFCATAVPRKLYESVEGYGGGRFVGPDKWYHWRVTASAASACFIRRPLFRYRWHATNQSAQQTESGALKFLLDEYAATFELDASILKLAGMTRAEFEQAFIEHDVVRHGLGLLAQGRRTLSRRAYGFGVATYPAHVRRNPRAWVLRTLQLLGPAGTVLANLLRARVRSQQMFCHKHATGDFVAKTAAAR